MLQRIIDMSSKADDMRVVRRQYSSGFLYQNPHSLENAFTLSNPITRDITLIQETHSNDESNDTVSTWKNVLGNTFELNEAYHNYLDQDNEMTNVHPCTNQNGENCMTAQVLESKV